MIVGIDFQRNRPCALRVLEPSKARAFGMLRSARDPDVGKETNFGQAKKNKKKEKEAPSAAVVFVHVSKITLQAQYAQYLC